MELEVRDLIIDKSLYTKIDKVNSSVVYLGQSRSPTKPPDTEASFSICRITKMGTVTTVEFANQGLFNQVWADRLTLFPLADFNNSHSTDHDGINDVSNGGNIHNFDHSDAFSYAIWLKPQNVAAERCIFAKATNDANVRGITALHTNTGAIKLLMRAPSGLHSHIFTDLILTAGSWNRLLVTHSGNSNKNGFDAYLNGVKSIVTPVSGVLSGTWLEGQDFTVGARNTAFPYSGLLNQLYVINKKLSDLEATEIIGPTAPDAPANYTFAANILSNNPLGTGDLFPNQLDTIGSNDLTMINMASDDFVEDTP